MNQRRHLEIWDIDLQYWDSMSNDSEGHDQYAQSMSKL